MELREKKKRARARGFQGEPLREAGRDPTPDQCPPISLSHPPRRFFWEGPCSGCPQPVPAQGLAGRRGWRAGGVNRVASLGPSPASSGERREAKRPAGAWTFTLRAGHAEYSENSREGPSHPTGARVVASTGRPPVPHPPRPRPRPRPRPLFIRRRPPSTGVVPEVPMGALDRPAVASQDGSDSSVEGAPAIPAGEARAEGTRAAAAPLSSEPAACPRAGAGVIDLTLSDDEEAEAADGGGGQHPPGSDEGGGKGRGGRLCTSCRASPPDARTPRHLRQSAKTRLVAGASLLPGQSMVRAPPAPAVPSAEYELVSCPTANCIMLSC